MLGDTEPTERHADQTTVIADRDLEFIQLCVWQGYLTGKSRDIRYLGVWSDEALYKKKYPFFLRVK